MIYSSDEWKGEVVFVIGGGPSLNKVNLDPLHDRRIIGVNNSYRLGDWVDICWFGDAKWWRWHYREIQTEYPGEIASCCDHTPLKKVKRIKFYQRGKASGIDERPRFVSWNRSSGGSAVNLAYHLGAAKIVLLGFDMKFDGEDKNWHRDHQDQDVKAQNKSFRKHYQTVFTSMIKCFKHINRDAIKLGVEIINCNPDSDINCFPVMSLEEYLKQEG